MSESATPGRRPSPPRENVWLNLLCNVVLPGFLLSQLSKEPHALGAASATGLHALLDPLRNALSLGPVWGLVVALAVPLGYGIWDYVKRRICNVFSILGLVSVVLTGVLGLLKTDAFWFAVKEAAIPLILGLAIPLSLRTRQPLVRLLLYNDQMMDTDRIHAALEARQTTPDFERLLARSSWILALSFFGSGLMNFILARWLLTAQLGTEQFNAQLGRMHWISWPVVFIPMLGVLLFALFQLLKGVERLTGLKGDEILHSPQPKKA